MDTYIIGGNIRIIYILLLLSLSYSAPVSIDKAERVAENIIIERFVSANSSDFTISSRETIKSDNIDLIYLFHLDPVGFVLVPADDRATPVLAYSFESDFIKENLPGNLTYILNLYKSEILGAIENNQDPINQIRDKWIKYISGYNLNKNFRNVDPLITAMFDQGCGWNNDCPSDPLGPCGYVWAGCGSVSMAQVMHYWGFPAHGNGSNSYNSLYGTLLADFENTTYEFDDMPDTYATEASQLLIFHSGVAIEMVYGPDVSWSYVYGEPSILYALQNFFFYEDNMYVIEQFQYNNEDYIQLLQNELDTFRPIIYRGADQNDQGGHIWNIDGYQDNQFHCNWGWSGASNGYFSLSTLTPSGLDLNYGQMAIINIQPQDMAEPRLLIESYESYEYDGDMDMVINPGETFELYSTLHIPMIFNDADNIELLLSSEESDISILNGSYIHGPLLSGESFFNENAPFIIHIDSSIQLGQKTFLLNAIVDANEISYEYSYELEVLVSFNQVGFPVSTAELRSSPLVIDLDGDGDKEIIFGDNNGFVHIYNADGTEVEDDTFPFNTGNQIWGSAAAADMDRDGFMDFVITSKSKHLYIFDQNGLKTDYNANKYLMGTPAIGNLDGDEDLEVVVGGYSSPSSSNQIFAVNPDGSDVEGFPLVLGEKTKAGVALADFNGNGKDDIIVGTDDDNIHVIYDDGTIAPGFPYNTGDKIQAEPSVADIDGGKVLFSGSNDNSFYAVNSDGSLRFSIETGNKVQSSPSFLDYNGETYIFFGSNDDLIYAVDSDGNALSGWPVAVNGTIGGSVVFSDLDNDGDPEVVAATDMGIVLAFNLDGSYVNYFPISNGSPYSGSPMITQLDNDGDLEIIAGSINSLVILDIKSLGNNDGYWNLFRGNEQRTGYAAFELEQLLGDINGDGILDILDVIILVNHILSPATVELEGADINNDNAVNILDVVELVSSILNL